MRPISNTLWQIFGQCGRTFSNNNFSWHILENFCHIFRHSSGHFVLKWVNYTHTMLYSRTFSTSDMFSTSFHTYDSLTHTRSYGDIQFTHTGSSYIECTMYLDYNANHTIIEEKRIHIRITITRIRESEYFARARMKFRLLHTQRIKENHTKILLTLHNSRVNDTTKCPYYNRRLDC